MITRRENLLQVLRGETPDWVPVTGHCDPYNQPRQCGMDPALAAALANVEWSDESTIVFSRYLGLDIADWFGPPITGRQRQVQVTSTREGDTNTTVWRTSGGVLRQVQRFSTNTNLWYTDEHMVKTAADLPVLAEVFADMEYAPAENAAQIVQARRDLIGDDGIILFALNGTPLGQMVRVHAGVETTAYLSVDAPQALRELFVTMEDNHLRRQKLVTALDGDAIVTVDDTSTTTISPHLFEEYCLGYTDRMAEAAHQDGKFYLHHSCGLIRDLLPLYRRTKMDAVHAFTIPPLGNVTIGEGRNLLGRHITICAGLVQLFGDMRDRAAVARSIDAMFEQAAPLDHFILCLAGDPEKTMDDALFVVNQCNQHTHRHVSTGKVS
ncbi:hypothetical protein HQ590_16675 [bacterium]|nr:hypothetical protein [bacterium]